MQLIDGVDYLCSARLAQLFAIINARAYSDHQAAANRCFRYKKQ
jgi:hypothetical protein